MGIVSKLINFIFGGANGSGPDPFERIGFVPPNEWDVESLGGSDRIFLAPEIEGDWQANIFVEVRRDDRSRSLADGLKDHIPNLQREHMDFVLHSSDASKNSHAVEFARIEYTNDSDGFMLRQWEMIFRLDGENRLFVQAASLDELWSKYEPVFQQFVDSLSIKPSPGELQ